MAAENKRTTEAEEPESKRAKTRETDAESGDVKVLRSALQGTDLGVPWWGGLRELLLAMAPAALGLDNEPSQKYHTLIAGAIGGVLTEEVNRAEKRVTQAQVNLQHVKAEMHECRTASEHAAETLQRKDTNSLLKAFADDCDGLSNAEASFMQCTRKMIARERDTSKALLQDHFKPIKDGTAQDLQKHVRILLRTCKKLEMDAVDIAVLQGAAEVKPADRTDVQMTALGRFEQIVGDYLATLEEVGSFNKKICFQPPCKTGAMSKDDAKAVVDHNSKKELAMDRANFWEFKRDNFLPLKTGKEGGLKVIGMIQAHHLKVIGGLIERIDPENVCLHSALPVALEKAPSKRGEFDTLVVHEIEKVLDNYINVSDDPVLGKFVTEEIKLRQFEELTNKVERIAENEVGIRETHRKALDKEVTKCINAKDKSLHSLKVEYQKGLQMSLTKTLKQLESSAGNPHTFQASLIEALPAALQRPLNERSDFDSKVIEHVESTLEERIKFIKDQIEIATASDSSLEEIVKALKDAQAALKRAGDRQIASAKAVVDEEQDVKRAKDALAEAKRAFLDSEARVAAAEAMHAKDQNVLEAVRQAIATLPSSNID